MHRNERLRLCEYLTKKKYDKELEDSVMDGIFDFDFIDTVEIIVGLATNRQLYLLESYLTWYFEADYYSLGGWGFFNVVTPMGTMLILGTFTIFLLHYYRFRQYEIALGESANIQNILKDENNLLRMEKNYLIDKNNLLRKELLENDEVINKLLKEREWVLENGKLWEVLEKMDKIEKVVEFVEKII